VSDSVAEQAAIRSAIIRPPSTTAGP